MAGRANRRGRARSDSNHVSTRGVSPRETKTELILSLCAEAGARTSRGRRHAVVAPNSLAGSARARSCGSARTKRLRPLAQAIAAAGRGFATSLAASGSIDLRAALAAKHGCKVENIIVGSGVDELPGLICRTYGAPGDPVLMSHGSYATFAFQVNGHGLALHTVPPFSDGSVDIEAMLARAREIQPKIAYLANPDNPSGTFAGRDAVARLRDELPPDTLFVLDEAYADFVTDGQLLPNGIDERTIRLYTFSKVYGMAGARIGTPRAARRRVQKIRNHFGVNRRAQIGRWRARTGRASGRCRSRGRRAEYHAPATRSACALPSG